MAKYDEAGRRVAQLLGLSTPPPGRIPAMLQVRRRIIDQPMVPSVVEAEKLVPDALVARAEDLAPLIQGSVNHADLARRAGLNLRADLGADNIVAGRWRGSFVDAPLESAGYIGVASYPKDVPNAGLARSIRRHEIMHGYNEAARQGLEGLPLSSWLVAKTPPAISRPLDELVAQRVGGTAFMDIPWDKYARSYADEGQSGAARVAQGLHAAQRAGRFASDYAPYLAAGAVGTGLTAYALTQDDEEERDRQVLLTYLQSAQ